MDLQSPPGTIRGIEGDFARFFTVFVLTIQNGELYFVGMTAMVQVKLTDYHG
jgi:hypothetical protein